MLLLKRILTSVDAIQAMIMAILNLAAVAGWVSVTEIELGALNLAIIAIARAVSKIVYGKDLEDLGAAVTAQADARVRVAKADIATAVAANTTDGAVDRGFLESLLTETV